MSTTSAPAPEADPPAAVTAAADASPTLWMQFHRMLRWARVLSYSVIGLFFFFAVVEAVRLYQFAAGIHPWFGYLSVVGMAAVLGMLVGVPAYRFLCLPRVINPPEIPERTEVRLSHLRTEVRYLDRYLGNCVKNEQMREKIPQIDDCRRELQEFSDRLKKANESNAKAMSVELSDWVVRNMSAVLHEVDEKADRIIYQESLAVGLATAASPNGTLDAFVVLWRSVNMVSRLGCLYYGRPGFWGTLSICRDVSVAAALAGYMQNVTDTLGGLLAKTLGGVSSVVAGPAVDGVTNGLVMIRIGYLAKQRCRSFRQWDASTRHSAVIAAISATQKVAFGLTAEILRQVGGRLSHLAGGAVGGLSVAAGSAADAIRQTANSLRNAANAAAAWGGSFSTRMHPKPDVPSKTGGG